MLSIAQYSLGVCLMFTVIECVVIQHHPVIVGASAAILLVGMLAFFQLLQRAEESTSRRRRYWIATAAFASGLSIWATHFVAMLAYQGSVPIGFDVGFTTISAIVAVIGIWWMLRLPAGGWRSAALTGCCMTGVIAIMHYLGMAGMLAAARIEYRIVPILFGTAVAVAGFTLSFWLFHRMKSAASLLAAALAASAAVCALHFTAMASTVLIPDPAIVGPDQSGAGRMVLTAAISGVTFVILLVTAVAAVIDRYLVDLKGFANATLDGLAVVREQRIIEANARFATLVGSAEETLIGQDPNSFLLASDGLDADVPRSIATEALPRNGDTARVFELAVHTIEYRGRPSEVLAIRDLTEKLTAQREIEYLARHDMLTGLGNRKMLHERLDYQVACGERNDEPFAVIALDLDRFKVVNDLFGHAEGDRVLKDVAGILSACIGSGDTVARLGGDEFMIVMAGGTQGEGAHELGRNILAAFREKMNCNIDPTAVGVSIGIALFPQDAADAPSLMRAADLALYRAKLNGRGMLAFYDLAMDRETKERRELEADLRHAIARDEMRLLYQPVMSVLHGDVVGYEALLRWRHAMRGDVPPEAFIPIAEETGAIFALGEWVLREACRAAVRWEPHIKVAVNISPVQFRVANLAFVVCQVLDETGLAPARLELEITETALLKDRVATLDTLRQLKALGVSIVMDDFGTGYSSLSNLQSFPFDKIKIDRSFIAAMSQDDNARAIVKAVVGLGRSLDLPVTAEGIETADQFQLVASEGCAQAQGYLFGRPGVGPVPMETGEAGGDPADAIVA